MNSNTQTFAITPVRKGLQIIFERYTISNKRYTFILSLVSQGIGFYLSTLMRPAQKIISIPRLASSSRNRFIPSESLAMCPAFITLI